MIDRLVLGNLRWLVCGGALLAACADDGGSTGDGACPTLKEGCTIGQASCQRQIFAATACIRGQSGAALPPIRTITRDEYADELRGAAAPEEDFGTRVWGTALGLFGWVPQEQSLQESDIAQRVGTIAAFYRRDTKDVTIIADTTMSQRGAVLTLSHEFVHALQDQREHLQPFYDEHARTSDAQLALRCLTEGEAVLLSNLTVLHFDGTGADDVDWQGYFGQWRGEELSDIAASDAPLLAARSLVYPLGGAGVHAAFEEGGVEGVRALYAAPPHALHYWAERPDGLREAEELDCDVPLPPTGFALRFVDRQGLAGVLGLLAGLGRGEEYAEAVTWRSDVFAVYSDPEEKSDDVLAAWRLRLEREADAQLLAQWVAESGRPIRADVQGRELVLTAATTSDLLEAWTERDACPPKSKSRRHAPTFATPPRWWSPQDALHGGLPSVRD